MAAHVMNVLLWLFLAANGVMVYRRALGLFHNDDATADNWVGLSLGAIFLVGFAWIVYAFGNMGVAHLAALMP